MRSGTKSCTVTGRIDTRQPNITGSEPVYTGRSRLLPKQKAALSALLYQFMYWDDVVSNTNWKKFGETYQSLVTQFDCQLQAKNAPLLSRLWRQLERITPMFGVKTRLRAFLNTIRPWPAGVSNRGWYRSDFFTTVRKGKKLVEVPIAAVKADRTASTHVIFALPTFTFSSFDAFFLGEEVVRKVTILNQQIISFNSVLQAFNAATDVEDRWALIVSLHVDRIGSYSGEGLYAGYMSASQALRKLEAK